MLHESASKSTEIERLYGYAEILIEHYGVKKGDCVIIISNSGRNAVPVDAALLSKSCGASVIALTSMEHTLKVTSRHKSEKRLFEIADVVLDNAAMTSVEKLAWSGGTGAQDMFSRAMYEYSSRQFNSALNYYGEAVAKSEDAAGVDKLYEAFYRMNRGVLRAEMIDFITSIESNVQVLSMDDSGNTRARVRDQVSRQYDYSEALSDMKAAAELVPDLPYVYFNLGNLYCLSSEHINSIDNYSRAIELYPYMGDAYFNRGLVLIYLKDKEKGCIDLSRAGELGVADAYSVIKKYCEDEKQ